MALASRIAGVSLEDIAERYGYATVEEVRMAIERALSRATIERDQEGVSHMRSLTAARLEALLHGVWDRAVNPRDIDQINAQKSALSIIDRQAALYGMNAPKESKVTHSVDAGTIADTLNRILHAYAGVEEIEVIDVIEADVIPALPAGEASDGEPTETPVEPEGPPEPATEA